MAEEPDDGRRSDDNQSTGGRPSAAVPRSALECERVFEALGAVRRRYLCYLLRERSELAVDDAVATITEWESDDGEPSPRHRERVKLSLLHNHIPKLRATNVVTFDPHSETLVTDDDADPVLAALEAVGTALCPDS